MTMLPIWIRFPFLIEWTIKQYTGLKHFDDSRVLALPKHKIAYIPVPKAANSSVRTALAPHLDLDASIEGGVHPQTRALLKQSSDFLDGLDRDWFVFTVVRDPVTRVRSAWHDKLIKRNEIFPPLRKMGMTTRLPFSDFLQRCEDWPSWALNDHFMPQSLLLKRASKLCDLRVFKLETLADSWSVVQTECARRGLENLADIGIMNQSSAPQTQLDCREVHLINKIYQQDFEMFGYGKASLGEPQEGT